PGLDDNVLVIADKPTAGGRSAPQGDQVGTLEDRGPYRRKRPGIPEIAERPVLRKADVIPVLDEPIVELEDEPERDRRQREKREFYRRRSYPRVPSRAKHDGVGEDDESGPGDRRVPGPERLDVRKRPRFGGDH